MFTLAKREIFLISFRQAALVCRSDVAKWKLWQLKSIFWHDRHDSPRSERRHVSHHAINSVTADENIPVIISRHQVTNPGRWRVPDKLE
jgi:hypothetical protein